MYIAAYRSLSNAETRQKPVLHNNVLKLQTLLATSNRISYIDLRAWEVDSGVSKYQSGGVVQLAFLLEICPSSLCLCQQILLFASFYSSREDSNMGELLLNEYLTRKNISFSQSSLNLGLANQINLSSYVFGFFLCREGASVGKQKKKKNTTFPHRVKLNPL